MKCEEIKLHRKGTVAHFAHSLDDEGAYHQQIDKEQKSKTKRDACFNFEAYFHMALGELSGTHPPLKNMSS